MDSVVIAAFVGLLLLASATRSSSQDLVCYCNQPNCMNSTCHSRAVRCETQVNINHNNTVLNVLHLCVDSILSCIPRQDHPNERTYSHCCDSDVCNKCQFPANIPPGVDLSPFIPEGCPIPTPTFFPPSPALSTPVQPTASLTTIPLLATGPSFPPPTSPPPLSWWLIVIVVLVATVIVLTFFAVLVIAYAMHKRRLKNAQVYSINNLADLENGIEEVTGTDSASSGAGLTRLEQRTIAREIKKVELIGKGRYGEVWLGRWCGEDVAIKIFSAIEQESFERECNMFKTYGLHHDNIVRYIISDTKGTNLGLELWMVIEYHSYGSLFDYLQLRTLTPSQLHKMVYSIASGLHFLHQDIQSGQMDEKPGIAHRDLKSRNVLVKLDGSCCITDLGLALRNTISTGLVDKMPSHPRQGTKRYMAPEILDGSINATLFDSYKLVDIYCFGLIMWEMAMRCEVDGEVNDYQLPYFNLVSHDPSFDEMRRVVVGQKMRPSIEKRWKNEECVVAITSIMQECWRSNPHARLSAIRIKKKSLKIQNGFKT